jgi:hypothetical protein
MPPAHNPETSNLGWKLAMALLGLIQTVGLALAWSTFSAISELRRESTIATYQLTQEVRPTLQKHAQKLEELEKLHRKP